MSQSDKVFAGSIPEFYDTHMVPLIFAPYARDLSARVMAVPPSAVLETAAGTGVLTRALAPKLAADARYTVTDLNQPMLDMAAARQGPDRRLDWRVADALDLPFPDATFDAVCCQFGVMFFPDRIAGYREVRRVLRPGGRFLFNVWDSIETNDFALRVTQGAAEVFPDDPPRFLARTPHGYHDVDQVCHELLAAGFRDIAVDTVTEISRAATPMLAAVAFCQGTPLRTEIEARDPARLDEVTRRAAAAIAAHHGAGPVAGRIQGHVIVAST